MKRQQLLLLSLLLVAQSALATHLPDDVEPGDSVNEIQLPLTQESAAELIRIETHGKVLSVAESHEKKLKIFKIKVLHKNGLIKHYRLNANTGHHIP